MRSEESLPKRQSQSSFSEPFFCREQSESRWVLAEEDETKEEPRTDLFIRGTTKLVVCGVAVIAAIVSYRHAYAVVTDYGERRS